MPALQSSSRYPTEVGVLIADVQMQSYKGTTRYLPHTNHTAQIPLPHGQFPSWYLHHMSGYRCHTQPLWPVPASFFPFFSLILYAALPCQPPKSSTFRGWFFFFFFFLCCLALPKIPPSWTTPCKLAGHHHQTLSRSPQPEASGLFASPL